MTVIIKNTDVTMRMGDADNVIGNGKNTKVPRFFQVTYVDVYVTNWVNADLVTHIVPRG